MSQRGIYTGMLDVYMAKMLTDDTSASAPTYDAPKLLGMGIEVSITPNYIEGELYASNVAARRAKRINNYAVKINTESMPPELVAYATGRTVDKNGVQMVAGGNRPGKIALGFVRTKDNGKKECWWLYKGELAEAAVTAKTGTGSIEYQTPALEGTFDRRIYDNLLAAVADEEDPNVDASVIQNWMSQVYVSGGEGTPSAASLPIGAVEAVAQLPAGDAAANTVYVLTSADGEKAAGTMWRKISGIWTQYNG